MKRSQHGFTLLEVLIALAILAGAITTVVVTFNRHLSLVIREKESTTALLLARAKLDEPGFLSSTTAEGSFAPEFSGITWKREQTQADYPGINRYLITITWQSGQRSLQLVTYGRQ